MPARQCAALNQTHAVAAHFQWPRGSDRSFQEIQIELSNRAGNLNQAASDVVTASYASPQQVASSSNRFSKAYEDFVDTGMDMAAVTTETETKETLENFTDAVKRIYADAEVDPELVDVARREFGALQKPGA